jgi:hypothetical protein
MSGPHAIRPGADTRADWIVRELRHRPDCMEPALPDTPPGEAGGRRSIWQENPSELDPREMARGTRVAAGRARRVSARRSLCGGCSIADLPRWKAKGQGVVCRLPRRSRYRMATVVVIQVPWLGWQTCSLPGLPAVASSKVQWALCESSSGHRRHYSGETGIQSDLSGHHGLTVVFTSSSPFHIVFEALEIKTLSICSLGLGDA